MGVTPSEKKGSSFCGACCDMRRAVIVLCIIALVLYTIGLLMFRSAANNPYFANFYGDTQVTLVMVAGGISIIGCVLSIVGAVKFNALLPVSIIET